MSDHICKSLNLHLGQLDHARMTVAYRGLASYYTYRTIERIKKEYSDVISNQLFEVILNGLRSRIVLDTCKFIHATNNEKLSIADLKINTDLAEASKKYGYQNIEDYISKIKDYRDKEISHCDYNHLYRDSENEQIKVPYLDISRIVFQKVFEDIASKNNEKGKYVFTARYCNLECFSKAINKEVSRLFCSS